MDPHRTQRGPHASARALGALLLCALPIASLNAPLRAQTHKVAAAEKVVRAVGVYEWTGDMAKPVASRLIPVSLFIDSKYEDAAVYLARPVPFALNTGNVYEIDRAGIALGTLDLAFARHLVASGAATTLYDDGWFGYGKFVPPTPPKPSTLRPEKTLGVINGLDDDDDRPHFSARSAQPGSGDAATPTSGAPAPSGTPAADPDRPTLHRSTSSSDQTASSSSGETPANDPDRPTLRRHSPQDASKDTASQPDANSAVAALNDDPNRPLLHRGKPVNALTDADIPKLAGLPADQDLHQMVAVSDAANRPPHDFSRAWQDDAEHQAILAKMQAAARAQLAAYEAANAPPAPKPTAPSPPDTRRINSKLRHAVAQETPPPPTPVPLFDEQLKGYTLSYGGAATYVYSAHTGGLGPTLCFVTLVAQVDMQGELQIAIKSVTDAAHLDRTPRMKLVDAVDAEASNRASLLFELRAQNSRQFALYRVIGAHADQTFLTGSTQ
jgi:cytochrome c553